MHLQADGPERLPDRGELGLRLLASGGALAFVTALGDFVTSILLYTFETRPISIEILTSLRVGELGVAAAFGVVLMAVSAAALGVGARLGR